MAKLTIITPCSRPENLSKILDSIDFNYVDEWMIVYDGTKFPPGYSTFKDTIYSSKISEYVYGDVNSCVGHAQRNYGMTMVKNSNTYIYNLDDDNIVHPDLYSFVETIGDSVKFYSFNQNNHGIISTGNRFFLGGIDTAIFIIHYSLCKDINWIVNKHDADGYFFLECYNLHKDKHEYIDKVLCYYNYLR